MPTPLEILLDPISVGLLTIYFSLVLIETVMPGHRVKKIKGWIPKSLLVFIFYFYFLFII